MEQTKKETIKKLLHEASILHSDYSYIAYKAPEILKKLYGIKKIPAEFKEEYDDAINEIEYIEQHL